MAACRAMMCSWQSCGASSGRRPPRRGISPTHQRRRYIAMHVHRSSCCMLLGAACISELASNTQARWHEHAGGSLIVHMWPQLQGMARHGSEVLHRLPWCRTCDELVQDHSQAEDVGFHCALPAEDELRGGPCEGSTEPWNHNAID
jgi:hypothetical protein